MSKYEIKRSCGHVEIHNIWGPGRDRERKAEWLEDGLCEECFAAQRAREHAEASARAAAEGQKNGYPILAGSEKQVAWANTIRAGFLPELEKEVLRFSGVIPPGEEQAEAKKKLMGGLGRFLEKCQEETSAKWWIDNREELKPRYLHDIEIRIYKQGQPLPPARG